MHTPLNTKPELIRLSAAAKIIGVSPYVLANSLNDREIPIEIIRIGKAFFVKSSELTNWLAPKPDLTSDLFR